MRISVPVQGSVRTLFGIAVWGGAVLGAVWLAQQTGAGDAVAIAEIREYKIAPSQLGRIISLDVAEGQQVAAGQVIARLETDLLEREISVAEAQLRQASSTIGASGASLDTGAMQAQRTFQSEIEAVHVEWESAQSDCARDRAELSKLGEDIERERDLVRRGLTRNDGLQAMEIRRAALDEAVRNWPRRIQAIEARRDAAMSRLAEWRRAHADGPEGSRATQLRPVEDRVRERRESVRLLRTQLQQMVLRASASGYVSAIHARPGDVVKPGDPVIDVVESHPRQVVAYVEEHHGPGIPIGTRVLATRRNSARDQLDGTVIAVAADVSEMPRRLWVHPQLPAWGRAVYINLPERAGLDAGEMVDVAVWHPRTTPGQTLLALWRVKRSHATN